MSNLNSNFLEDDENQIYEEIVEEIFEEEQMEESQNEILSEAEKRIEQANLYQALLKHDLFGPGSARQEIIDSVRKEFKTFILSRLEILLGIKQEQEKAVTVQSPFSDDEVNALKAIASRLVKKDPQQTASVPVVNQVPTSQPVVTQKPVVNTINLEASQSSSQPKKIIKKTVIQRKAVNEQVQEQPVSKKARKKESQNLSPITGQDYSQVVADDPALRPKPMPSQAEMDMINARQAEMNSRSSSPVGGEAGTAGLGAKIAAVLMKS